jgi:signal transduction histidine kinase
MDTSGITQSLWNRLKQHYARSIHFLYTLFIAPRKNTEDEQRHEFILNILLTGSIGITSLLDISLIMTRLSIGSAYRGINISLFTAIVGLFVVLLILSRKGHVRLSSYILVLLYFIAATYCIHRWGIELPLAAFGYVLTIIISSILINTRFGFMMTLLVASTLIASGYLQIIGYTIPNLYWKTETIRLNDPFELSTILLLIMTVSWLSNREIERSLKRARKSEQELLIERDNLEIKVEERTRELKNTQQEKFNQLYKFAEFGKISSGIFHDLMTPLTALINTVSELDRDPKNLSIVKEQLSRAVSTSKRMGEFLSVIRKQVSTDQFNTDFSLNNEIQEAIDILQYRTREANAVLKVTMKKEITLFGNALRFHQIVLNVIANAIDAVEHTNTEPYIKIKLNKINHTIIFTVHDRGCGISDDIKGKIFEPFFTTKTSRGIGLGLSTAKSIVEDDFGGSISIESTSTSGTLVTVTIPIRKKSS